MDAAKKAANAARRLKRKSRGRGLRKTTGCTTCKRRHLKCDESLPECGPCRKSKQICIYVESLGTSLASEPSTIASTSTPGALAFENETGNDAVSQAQSLETGATQGSATPDVPSAAHNGPLISPPPWHSGCEIQQAASNLIQLNSCGPDPPSLTQTSLTPPNAAFSRWFDLLTSDVWGLSSTAQDDIPHPPSPTSLRNIIATNGSFEDVPRQRSATAQPAEATRSCDIWKGSKPAQLSEKQCALFRNFVRNLSHWIDLHDPSRCFATLVPRLADAGLMNAILALSARQLSIRSDAPPEDRDRNVGLQYYYETLHYLQEAMHHDSYTVSLELLATALIVSMYEMLDDSGNGWERHLKGVFWIQRSQVIQGESGGLKQAVWWAWLRQDVWAAFRERRKTLSFWKPTKPYGAMSAHEIAARVVWIFAKAVDYCSDDEVEAGEANLQGRIARAETIFAMLAEWHDNLPPEFASLPGRSKPVHSEVFNPIWIYPPEFGISVQLYHSACILLLMNKPSSKGMRGYLDQQKQLEKAIEAIVGIAAALDDDAATSLVSSQCLYIAGLCAQDSRQKESIVHLIDDCHRKTGWPTNSLSKDLNEQWAKIFP